MLLNIQNKGGYNVYKIEIIEIHISSITFGTEMHINIK